MGVVLADQHIRAVHEAELVRCHPADVALDLVNKQNALCEVRCLVRRLSDLAEVKQARVVDVV